MVHVPATTDEVRRAGHHAVRRLTRAIAELAAALGKERSPDELVAWLDARATEAESLASVYATRRRDRPKSQRV